MPHVHACAQWGAPMLPQCRSAASFSTSAARPLSPHTCMISRAAGCCALPSIFSTLARDLLLSFTSNRAMYSRNRFTRHSVRWRWRLTCVAFFRLVFDTKGTLDRWASKWLYVSLTEDVSMYFTTTGCKKAAISWRCSSREMNAVQQAVFLGCVTRCCMSSSNRGSHCGSNTCVTYTFTAAIPICAIAAHTWSSSFMYASR
mmetsp:Transcript_17522/g.44647  ORF Transcript_17522/g.44647 Transcript_17522/m.44647 type:complete len:201 (-) Transcript_17522:448-1050(-)